MPELKVIQLASRLVEYATQLSPDQPEREGPHHFRASEVGDCENKLVSDHRFGNERERESRGSLRLAFGTEFHNIIRRWARKAGVEVVNVEWDMRLKLKPLVITGHMDLAVFTKGTLTPVDIKTTTDVTHRIHMNELSRSYVDQLRTYHLGLVTKDSDSALISDYGLILLVNLQGDIQQVEVDCSKPYDDIYDRLMRVYRKRLADKVGKREYNKYEFPCTYCQHRQSCWNIDPQIIRPGEKRIKFDDLDEVEQKLLRRALVSYRASKYSKDQSNADKGRCDDRLLRLLDRLEVRRLKVPGYGEFRAQKNGLRITLE